MLPGGDAATVVVVGAEVVVGVVVVVVVVVGEDGVVTTAVDMGAGEVVVEAPVEVVAMDSDRPPPQPAKANIRTTALSRI